MYDVSVVDKTLSIKVNTNQTNSAKTPTNSKQAIKAQWDGNQLKCDTKLSSSLRKSIIDHPKTEDDYWLNFALVGNDFRKNYPNFNPEDYGYTKLATIIKKIDLFETKIVDSTFYVRCKTP